MTGLGRCDSEGYIALLARCIADREVICFEWQSHAWLPLFHCAGHRLAGGTLAHGRRWLCVLSNGDVLVAETNGMFIGQHGALLVADDVGNVVWRVRRDLEMCISVAPVLHAASANAYRLRCTAASSSEPPL